TQQTGKKAVTLSGRLFFICVHAGSLAIEKVALFPPRAHEHPAKNNADSQPNGQRAPLNVG
ncbi:MAG: hypothetical protein LBD30_05715, partial [Verrucomicrobiales bacterium]|nr:hypothetical protein [Verrucomicrobiales bacterium]